MVSKLRIHELGKALGRTSKELMEEFQKLGFDVKNHMAVVDESMMSKLERSVGKEKLDRARQLTTPPPKAVPSVEKPVVRRKGAPTIVTARTESRSVSAAESAASAPTRETVFVKREGENEAVAVDQVRVSGTIIRRRRSETAAAPVSAVRPESKVEATEPTLTASPSPATAQAAAAAEPQSSAPLGAPIENKAEAAAVRPAVEPPPLERPPADFKETRRPAGGYKKVRKVREDEFDPRQYLKVADEEDMYRPARKKKGAVREQQKTVITQPKASKRVIRIEGEITVQEFAHRLQVKSSEILRKLMGLGVMATLNQKIDVETATLIATEYQYEVQNVRRDVKDLVAGEEDQPESLVLRPPVVTIMGHVDHGKTTLLDTIRKANVAAGESGGITQHIGAYSVDVNGRKVVFVDTPGHEAFTAMRSRGASVTDIVVLVVAAEEGPKPQTKEAIAHAKAAKVPIVVALNKIDKPDANPEAVKQALAGLELVPEEWGGDTLYVPVSGKTGKGVPELLETLALQAEVLDLKANPNKRGRGIIVESRLDRGTGPVCTVIVKEGTLRDGDIVVSGTYFGRVRAMFDHSRAPVKEAPPSTPVEVVGLPGVPTAGDMLFSVESEEKAREVIEINRQRIAGSRQGRPMSLEAMYSRMKEGALETLHIVLKTDVQGSIEAIREVLKKTDSEEVRLDIAYSGVGAISDSDIHLALASHALVIGFNVRPSLTAKKMAEQHQIDIRTYTIIYELVDDVRQAMLGRLKPEYLDNYLGRAEVRNIFKVTGVGTIAGCFVVDGKVLRTSRVRVLREGVQVYDGRLASLKRFKEDAREVQSGLECGIAVENFNDAKVGDILEFYDRLEQAPKLTARVGGD